MSAPLKAWLEEGASVLRLRLNRPKANIIDAEMIKALDGAFAQHLDHVDLKCVILDAEGPNFSFGASVEEHLPGRCAAMLKILHKLLFRMLESPVPILVAVKGQCLGGGLEVALAGNLIFATPSAHLGQPEIKIGVIAPAASCLLSERVGRAVAEDMLFSGRSLTGQEAYEAGLVTTLDKDPLDAAISYYRSFLKPFSASSLRHVVKAARLDLVERLKPKFDEVERIYLDELMNTRDAVEGLQAFIDKRPAEWENR